MRDFLCKKSRKKCDLPPLTYTAAYVIINSVRRAVQK
nr:MAG TPA: hypothetical protein [Caudoviricetes sp.]